MYKFGILGCGMIAGIHAKAIGAIKNARLIGVADANVEYSRAFAQKHDVKAYESYAEMLSDDIDVVCICTPSCFHAEGAIEAMRAGKHVVLEKPMALSTESADEVIRVSDETGKLVTVICQLRFSEDVQRLCSLVQENAFGRITLCNLSMKYYRSTEYYTSSPWKGRIKFDGGGALMNQGIHGIDLIEYIVGDIKGASGIVRTLSHKIEVEDTAVATVEFECGALGVIEASTCAYPGFERRIEIHGDRGYAVLVEDRIKKLMVNGEKQTSFGFDTVKTASDPSALESKMHKMQIKNLLRAIEGEERLLIDAREGRRAIRVIEDIYKSSGR